jgi:hypothetical protein
MFDKKCCALLGEPKHRCPHYPRPHHRGEQVTRWTCKGALTDGRVFIRYAPESSAARVAIFDVPGCGPTPFRRDGHWDYDRCEVIGASDLGNIEEGQ